MDKVKLLRKAFIVSSAVVLTASPLMAFALPKTCSELVTFIQKFSGALAAILFAISVLVFLYSAFLFLTGGGNEETLKTAKQYLVWAIVGLIVALFAFVIPGIVQNVLESNASCGGAPSGAGSGVLE